MWTILHSPFPGVGFRSVANQGFQRGPPVTAARHATPPPPSAYARRIARPNIFRSVFQIYRPCRGFKLLDANRWSALLPNALRRCLVPRIPYGARKAEGRRLRILISMPEVAPSWFNFGERPSSIPDSAIAGVARYAAGAAGFPDAGTDSCPCASAQGYKISGKTGIRVNFSSLTPYPPHRAPSSLRLSGRVLDGGTPSASLFRLSPKHDACNYPPIAPRQLPRILLILPAGGSAGLSQPLCLPPPWKTSPRSTGLGAAATSSSRPPRR
ncbi:MAG: hypothetical protein QG602_3613 [Verrucomicrobiota bacterium]|nr:hypothetical protein [Verrucomicrobiota bacterium]